MGRGSPYRDPINVLESWTQDSHTAGRLTHLTYRRGSGTGVIVIHEVPGLVSQVVEFADEVVARGHTVVLPHLFGSTPERTVSMPYAVGTRARLWVSRESAMFALNRTAPIATWLRSLARSLHDELGGPGVGAVGMSFTGGYAPAMLADAPVAPPISASTPPTSTRCARRWWPGAR